MTESMQKNVLEVMQQPSEYRISTVAKVKCSKKEINNTSEFPDCSLTEMLIYLRNEKLFFFP